MHACMLGCMDFQRLLVLMKHFIPITGKLESTNTILQNLQSMDCHRPSQLRGNRGNGGIRGNFSFPRRPNIHLQLQLLSKVLTLI